MKRRKVKSSQAQIPRGKWINAKIRVTKDGKVQAQLPRSVVKNPAAIIKPLNKEYYEREIRPRLRAPYNLMPFALYKRTRGKGTYLLVSGGQILKVGTKAELKRFAGSHAA